MTGHSIPFNNESSSKRREILNKGRAAAAYVAFIACILLLASPASAAETGKERGTRAQAKVMVAQAIVLYDLKGAAAAFERFNQEPAPDYRYWDLFIFVMDAADGKMVAHALAPSFVGLDIREIIDPAGVNVGQVLIDAANPGGAWADYQAIDPASGEIVAKSTWAVLHDGYIFGCGIHPQ
ncbi:MAG: cache domain-containing protein [Acidiferrobacterales bacterium]|nr:cache domain-containing protein [Acidiferrobacterales bacterium]